MSHSTSHILVTGAAGAGTSTLGAALATHLGMSFQEADLYYWHSSQPPFTEKRSVQARSALLRQALKAGPSVVAGSVMGWEQDVENAFRLIFFLQVPTAIRLQRLTQREQQRFGHADPAFLAWAAQYDSGPPEGRSLQKHLTWLATRTCPVVHLTGDHPVAELLSIAAAHASHHLHSSTAEASKPC